MIQRPKPLTQKLRASHGVVVERRSGYWSVSCGDQEELTHWLRSFAPRMKPLGPLTHRKGVWRARLDLSWAHHDVTWRRVEFTSPVVNASKRRESKTPPRLTELILDAAKEGFKIRTWRKLWPGGWATQVVVKKNSNPFVMPFLDTDTEEEIEEEFRKVKEAASIPGPLRVRVVR